MTAISDKHEAQDIEVRDLVKRFSFELEDDMNHNRLDESAQVVAKGIVLHRDYDDAKAKELERWRTYFDGGTWASDSDIALLDIESQNLRDAKEEFYKILPADDRFEGSRSKQDPAAVVVLVNSAIQGWEKKHESSKFGKAKKLFHKVCSSIDQHSTLLEILPQQNEYVALFYGTVQVVIKASVNYQKIAEGFSQALSEISDEVAAITCLFPVYRTKSMQGAVARIYAQIFLFLKRVINWYKQKSVRRFLSSLREDVYDCFRDDVSLIKRLSQNIIREAQTSAFAEERYTRLRVEGIDEKLQYLLDAVGRQGAERKAAEERMHRERMQRETDSFRKAQALLDQRLQNVLRQISEQLPFQVGEPATILLQNQAYTHFSAQDEEVSYTARRLEYPISPISSRRSSPVPSTCTDETSRTSGRCVRTRTELQLYSAHLAEWYKAERNSTELPENPFIEQQIISALQEWTTEDHSSQLYISGPHQASPALSSVVASEYVKFAMQSSLPAISFFCSLEDFGRPRLGMTNEAHELVALTYSLIRQLLEIVPPEIHATGPDLEEARFKRLNGTLDTYADALSLLSDLISLIAPFLLIVIDGLQCLDDRSTDIHIASFVSALDTKCSQKSSVHSSTSKAIVKVLFTTAGHCGPLFEVLSADEIVIMKQASSRRTPGKARPGRQSLSPVREILWLPFLTSFGGFAFHKNHDYSTDHGCRQDMKATVASLIWGLLASTKTRDSFTNLAGPGSSEVDLLSYKRYAVAVCGAAGHFVRTYFEQPRSARGTT